MQATEIMKKRVAVVGAGISGLTTSVVFAEEGYEVAILADETGRQTTSAAAAAIWFPYDAEPIEKVIPWALETYKALFALSRKPCSGVSIIALHQFSRTREIEIPAWATSLGAVSVPRARSAISTEAEKSLIVNPDLFKSGFSLRVPLTDTTIYLDYLRRRLTTAGGAIHGGVRLTKLEEVDSKFELVINCAGIGARELVDDLDLEPHRGQVVIVPKMKQVENAIVCDDEPLMYAIPRANFPNLQEGEDSRSEIPR